MHTFKNNEGMISNMKFLKMANSKGKYIFYVKDTVFIVKYDLETKSSFLIGEA